MVCPSLYLIPRLLKHAEATKARGTLVIPHWPSAPFWPILFPDGSHPQKWVQQMAELPNSQELFLPATPINSPFVKTTLEGMQQLLAKPAVKKAPITPAMLEDMVKVQRRVAP